MLASRCNGFHATYLCSGSGASKSELGYRLHWINMLEARFRSLHLDNRPLLQEAEAAAAAAPAGCSVEDISQPPPDDELAPGDDATIGEIQAYFLKRQQVPDN